MDSFLGPDAPARAWIPGEGFADMKHNLAPVDRRRGAGHREIPGKLQHPVPVNVWVA
jgi:hypothetical protein